MRFNLVSVFKTETKMGTYTTNYNLYMPTIGEQGWGDLINGNYQTIDTTMKSLSNSIGTLETETTTFDERITVLENNTSNLGKTLSYSDYYTISGTNKGYDGTSFIPIISSPVPFSGKVSVKASRDNFALQILTHSGLTSVNLTTTQKEYTVDNAINVYIMQKYQDVSSQYEWTLTIGIPIFI